MWASVAWDDMLSLSIPTYVQVPRALPTPTSNRVPARPARRGKCARPGCGAVVESNRGLRHANDGAPRREGRRVLGAGSPRASARPRAPARAAALGGDATAAAPSPGAVAAASIPPSSPVSRRWLGDNYVSFHARVLRPDSARITRMMSSRSPACTAHESLRAGKISTRSLHPRRSSSVRSPTSQRIGAWPHRCLWIARMVSPGRKIRSHLRDTVSTHTAPRCCQGRHLWSPTCSPKRARRSATRLLDTVGRLAAGARSKPKPPGMSLSTTLTLPSHAQTS